MAINFYEAALEHTLIGLNDVTEFLAINAPPAERPEEGLRIDFKEEIPADFGKYVASFANAYGGLLFVGVQDDDGRPVALPGVARNGELRTKLVGKIVDTVEPRPSFSICTVPTADGRDVGVVQVKPGGDLPYLFKSTPYVRVGDSTRKVGRAELDALYARARNLAKEKLPKVEYIEAHRVTDQGTKTPWAQQLLSVRPVVSEAITVDWGTEQLVTGAFSDRLGFLAAELSVEEVDGEHFQFARGGDQSARCRFDGACHAQAALEMVTGDPAAAGQPRVLFLKAAMEQTRELLGVCAIVLSQLKREGHVRVAHQLKFQEKECRLHADQGLLELMNPRKQVIKPPFVSDVVRVVDFSNLSQSAEILADIFLRHARRLLGARVTRVDLLNYINANPNA